MNLNANNCDSLAQLCNQTRTTGHDFWIAMPWKWLAV